MNKIAISDEEIYELREQGLSYARIAEYYNKQGISVSKVTIKDRCKKIYAKKGEEKPKAKRVLKPRNGTSDEEIYKLREQGLTHEQIAEYYTNNGIPVSTCNICKRCKIIYTQKGKEEPKLKRGLKLKVEILDEEIYELREQGLSYTKIAEYYNNQGIPVTSVAIYKRCKKIYAQKGKEEPKVKKGRPKTIDSKEASITERTKPTEEELIKAISKLRGTKNATDEQIKKMAEYYGVDLISVEVETEEEEK